MLELGTPLLKVLKGIRAARNERYGLTRGFYAGDSDLADIEHEDAERIQSIFLGESARAVGHSLENLGLAEAGLTLRAVRRPGVSELNISDEIKLQPQDVVVVQGSARALVRAERILLG
jgi:CPA2 family monovalent cation:H+ antiporter-2